MNGICNRCGSTNCQIINEVHTSGKDFSASKSCCGWVLLGPIGLLCFAAPVAKESRRRMFNTGYVIIAETSGEHNEQTR